MALLKLNVFHWHIVDAQSFPFKSEVKPRLSEKGAFAPTAVYTLDQVTALVKFAAARGVRVVAEFDMPAHTSAWGNGYPEIMVKCPPTAQDKLKLHALTGCSDGSCQVEKIPWAMNPASNTTFEFLEEFLPEVWSVFDDEYMHFGGDEATRECWEYSPALRATGKDRSQLQGDFTKRVQAFAQQHGKTAVLWDEAMSLPQGSIPPGSIIQVWRGWSGFEHEVRRAHSMGHRTLQSKNWYHDLLPSWRQMYDAEIEDADSLLTLGGESCSWSEFAGPSNIDHRIFQNLPAVAERLWSTDALTKTRDGLTTFRMMVVSCHLRRAAGIMVASPVPDYCPPLLSLNTAPLHDV
jgi:hexosaminidase